MARGRQRFGGPSGSEGPGDAPRPRDPRAERRAAREARRGRTPLSPEERAYEEARRAVSRKMGFFAHLVPYLSVCFFLLFVAGFRAAFIVALSWGIGVACHFFAALVAPRLRERLVHDEVARQVQTGVSRERRQLTDEHAHRLEALSASIAHEIRNPITAAKSLVQQMGEDPRSGENVEYAKVALEELDRVERSISHLLRFARDEEMRLGDVRLAEVVRSALDTVGERVARLGVQVLASLDGAGSLVADAEQLRRVLLNLLGNALDAFEEGHTPAPRLELQAGHNLAGTELWLRVRDNGPGMDERRLAKIFDPFYTSKAEGTGLGLAISKKLVAAHGGRIEAHSQPGEGTEFLLTLPRAHAEAVARR